MKQRSLEEPSPVIYQYYVLSVGGGGVTHSGVASMPEIQWSSSMATGLVVRIKLIVTGKLDSHVM